MYNGVGLTTPRGSGTSGYVQKNIAYVNKTTSKMQFQKELEALKANPPKPPKKPNKEILDHEQKRLIEIQLINFRKVLESESKDTEEIELGIKRAREYLHSRLNDAPLIAENTSHSKILKKSEEIARFENAFNISKDYVPGSGFDFEAIEEKRKKENEEKKIKAEIKKNEEKKVKDEAAKIQEKRAKETNKIEEKIEKQEDKGKNREEKGKNYEEKGKNREEKGKNHEEKGKNHEEKGKNHEEKGKNHEEKGKHREERNEKVHVMKRPKYRED